MSHLVTEAKKALAALNLAPHGREEARVAMTLFMQKQDPNGCWRDDLAKMESFGESTLTFMAANCLRWHLEAEGENEEAVAEARKIALELLSVHHFSKPYATDAEAKENGYAPMDLEEICSMLEEVY